jgi:hypothetical protein
VSKHDYLGGVDLRACKVPKICQKDGLRLYVARGEYGLTPGKHKLQRKDKSDFVDGARARRRYINSGS